MGSKDTRRVGLAYDAVFLEHDAGLGHPERPERLRAILRELEVRGLREKLVDIAFGAATQEQLERCHTRGYIEQVEREVQRGRRRLSTGDTGISGKSWEAAVRAAGAGIAAVDAVCAGKLGAAFCAVRPPGHHASAGKGEGFCIFNNVALAAMHARVKHGLERVLIVDWDVHHGNGTQNLFYEDGGVYYFSTHQSPLYPGTGKREERGRGAGEGTIMNFPFRAGAGRKEIFDAFENHLLPAMQAYRPELVLISAGFDSRRGDLLGDFRLDDEDFADLTRMMMKLADEYAAGRVVSMLEGGYSLKGLATATASHVGAMVGV